MKRVLIMSKKQTIHVVPTKDGKWANKKPNSKRASSIYNTQSESRSKTIQQVRNREIQK